MIGFLELAMTVGVVLLVYLATRVNSIWIDFKRRDDKDDQ